VAGPRHRSLPARLARLARPPECIVYPRSASLGLQASRASQGRSSPQGCGSWRDRSPATSSAPVFGAACLSYPCVAMWQLAASSRAACSLSCPPGTRRPQSCSLARPVPTGIVLCTLANRSVGLRSCVPPIPFMLPFICRLPAHCTHTAHRRRHRRFQTRQAAARHRHQKSLTFQVHASK
jgi:hypothetical protein